MGAPSRASKSQLKTQLKSDGLMEDKSLLEPPKTKPEPLKAHWYPEPQRPRHFSESQKPWGNLRAQRSLEPQNPQILIRSEDTLATRKQAAQKH